MSTGSSERHGGYRHTVEQPAEVEVVQDLPVEEAVEGVKESTADMARRILWFVGEVGGWPDEDRCQAWQPWDLINMKFEARNPKQIRNLNVSMMGR